YEEKGMVGRRVRAMVLGVPNVGKSSLINRICGNKKTKVENRPGVTLDKQWVTTSVGVDLLDMPGILWPKFEERRVGENLALTGAIRDGVLDLEALAVILCKRLRRLYPELLSTRYKLGDMEAYRELSDYDLFLAIGKKRGFLVSGGEINTERTANTLIEEFRSAKIGRITLDRYSKEELPDA
ncbi:MAG: 50S ribosome-binding GTPase, partial [Clostridia bacterium]|nr:50S ribosome-binding GTPase [Clostridia bacterium]